jgi:SAM-dependent methyltransferase
MAGRGYNHYRLPLVRRGLGLAYWLETLTVQRTWHVRRALKSILRTRGPRFALLDMGCGLGDDIFACAPAWPQATFTGVDHVAENVLVCRTYAKLRGFDHVVFREADFRDPGVAASADVVLLSTVLQYVDDPAVPLGNARSILTQDGVLLVFQDVYAAHDPSRAAASMASVRDHDRRYSPADVVAFVERAGFRVERTEHCQGRLAARAEEILRRILQGAKHGRTRASIAALLLIGFMPVYLLVQWIDFGRAPRSGAGLLIVARPQAIPRSP